MLHRPRIICWTQERHWKVGVQTPNWPVSTDWLVTQDGLPLKPDEYREYRWPLAHPAGTVEVTWLKGIEKTWTLPVHTTLFRIDRWGIGHPATKISSGTSWYLAIVPANLVRDEARAGAPPIYPEDTLWYDRRAHYFTYGDEIAFEIPNYAVTNA